MPKVQAKLSWGASLEWWLPGIPSSLRVARRSGRAWKQRCLSPSLRIPKVRTLCLHPLPPLGHLLLSAGRVHAQEQEARGVAWCSPGESPCRYRQYSPPSGCSLLCSLPGPSRNQHHRTPSPAMVPGSSRRKSVSQARPLSPAGPLEENQRAWGQNWYELEGKGHMPPHKGHRIS